MTVGASLAAAICDLQDAGDPTAALDAEVLLAHTRRCTREDLLAHRDAGMSPEESSAFAALVARRRRFEPVAYLTGVKEFYGREFLVTPEVLIPRPATETLVDAVRNATPPTYAGSILDVGTGSGNIAITLALERPRVQVTATDSSTAALTVARANAIRLGAHVPFLQSDLLRHEALSTPDILVANLPYLPQEVPTYPEEIAAHRYEPASALYGGGTQGEGLIEELVRSLAQRGWRPSLVLLEIDPRQETHLTELAKTLFPQCGATVLPDLTGAPRVLRLAMNEKTANQADTGTDG
ncbi:MAG: peptide chain release factor N(5)-glutamine methyltransferase [Candidatus Kerfeldbacteria bacterium]|nr:peptide chain release factor N(5)-glutamine methyltransferase [Candidatus Kerfeldbacteria bacterium]